MGKCTFQTDWLNKTDSNGCIVSDWARKHSETEGFCIICAKSFSISKGYAALEQHASSTKHRENWSVKQGPSQLRICVEPKSNTDQSQPTQPTTSGRGLQLYSSRDATAKAELVWLLQCIASDFPASSCDGIAQTFGAMFPNADLTGFSLSRTKARYLVTDALAPFFRETWLEEARSSMYTLCYDETTNSAGRKELQTALRYWSSSMSKIMTMHLQTFFIGSAKGEDLVKKLTEALQNAALPLKNLVMLGSDGPNVNKKVERLMNELLVEERGKPLVNVGTCNIHILHNAFLKGIDELGEDASDLIFAVHNFFKDWPARSDDFIKIQIERGLPTHRFIKHVSSRWLTMEQAADRLLEQWSAVEEYFNKFIPKKCVSLSKKPSYMKIARLLAKKTMKAEVHFAASSARIFTNFTGFFQKEEPLVHIVYTEIERLIRTIMGRVCKLDVCPTNSTPTEDVLAPENLLPPEQIVVTSEVSAELANVKELDRLNFLSRARKHYVATARHVIQKSGLKNDFFKRCATLHPSLRKSKAGAADIAQIAKQLPLNIEVDVLIDEWNALRNVPDALGSEKGRIDLFWNQFFEKKALSGGALFPTVSRVIKAALVVSHGNADVERGFSTSSRILTDDRASMKERTLDGLMTVKSVLRLYDNKPHLVPITKKLLALAYKSHKSYKEYLENEKKKKQEEEMKIAQEKEKRAEEEKKRKEMKQLKCNITEKEEELKLVRKEEEEKRKTADKLFTEANSRLKKAIEKNDMQEVELAQAMMEGVSVVRREQASQKRTADTIEECILKKKDSLITSFFSKRPKKS